MCFDNNDDDDGDDDDDDDDDGAGYDYDAGDDDDDDKDEGLGLSTHRDLTQRPSAVYSARLSCWYFGFALVCTNALLEGERDPI